MAIERTTERRPRVIFSHDQQQRVDELLNTAFGRGRRKAEEEAEAEMAALKAEIGELKNKKTFAFWRR